MRISSSDTKDRDWRYNLARITDISHIKEAKSRMISAALSDSLVVKNDVYLLLNESKGINVKNNTTEPIKSAIEALSKFKKIAVAGQIVSGAAMAVSAINTSLSEDDGSTSGTFYPWSQSIKAWSGTPPLSLSYKFEFHMGQYGLWNALEEVVKPILCLVAPVLPQQIGTFMQYGPFPNAWGMLSNTIVDLIKNIKDSWSSGNNNDNSSQTEGNTENVETQRENENFSSVGAFLEYTLLRSYMKYTYDITFGNYMSVYKMLMTECKTTFSNEMDDKGYPVAGTAECTFEGILPPAFSSSTTHNLAMRFGERQSLTGLSESDYEDMNKDIGIKEIKQ